MVGFIEPAVDILIEGMTFAGRDQTGHRDQLTASRIDAVRGAIGKRHQALRTVDESEIHIQAKFAWRRRPEGFDAAWLSVLMRGKIVKPVELRNDHPRFA